MKLFQKVLFNTTVLLLLSNFTILSQDKTIPLDSTIRYGKLDNGLTYYIKHNEKPENRAEFYLVINAGAILETDAQNGLAHFCEHMCFNGTKNFPDKEILDYFETVGMQFGRNINAGTGIDRTTYMLMETPVMREGIIDTALLALKDMSHYVSFIDDEIDKERGVIHEEWRTRRNADFRLSTAINPIMYKGSKYAERDVIGSLDVIDNCPYDSLRKFYKDWYRPDLQAIIVVGDINEDQIEAKIKEYYSEIPARENSKERITYEVPDNKEPLIAIATDKEAQNTNIRIYYKHNYIKPEDKDVDYYIQTYKNALYTTMLNERFSELVQKENPPFINAFNYYGNYAGNKNAYVLGAFANNNVETGLTTLLVESQRVKQHGFTESELERAKTDLLRGMEKAYKEKDQQRNSSLAREYRRHYLGNSPTPGIEYEYEFAKKILPTIQLEEINQLANQWITNENIVITITGPEKEDVTIPSEEKVLNILTEIENAKIDPYVDQVSNKPLLEDIPNPGKIIKEESSEELGITEWTLSNDIKIFVKPTDFKEDEILFNAYSPGGTSLYSLEDLTSAEFATTIVSRSGISDFSLIELQKMLTGKVVSVSPYINDLYEGFTGNASPNDFETALQLIHLYFTNPRFDETAANAYFERYKAYLQNKASNPDAVFSDSVSFILSNRNPRKQPLNAKKLDKIDFETAKQIYYQRFADAGDFTFVFVGNIDLEKTKSLIEKYLGSLPTESLNETWKDNHVRYPEGKVNKVIEKDLQVSKSTVFINMNGNFDYDLEHRILLQTIKHVLQIVYTERIREDEGGSYGASVWAVTSEYPVEDFGLNIAFDCDAEKAEKLKGIVYEEIDNMIKTGPSEENLNKAKENFLKNRENSLKENSFWLNAIIADEKHDENNLDDEAYTELVKSMTIEKVRKAAEQYLTQGNVIEIRMIPTE